MSVQLALLGRVARRNILDLPDDILIDIFSYFQHEAIDEYGQPVGCGTADETRSHFQDIRNARLVCRVFHQFVSPHLCPVIRLPLEQSSLDKIEMMVRNPFILEGVRVIQSVLHYRPKEIAQSLTLFRQHRLTELDEMHRSCSWHEESWYLGGHDYDDDTVCELPHGVYAEAMANYHEIRSAWRLDSDPDWMYGQANGDKLDLYLPILRQGHQEYRKKHEEQYRLVTDGSFVEAVSKLVSQLPGPCWLEFTDEMPYLLDQYNRDPIETLNNRERLSQYMSTPHKWRVIEALGKEPDLAPIEILATLPIAIHQQGTMLQGVNVNCFPLVDGHYGICGQSQHPLWDDLAASCKNLRTFSWGRRGTLNHKDFRYEPPQGEDRACLDKLFGAMLSSPRLEYIYLNFYAFGLHDGKGNNTVSSKTWEFDVRNVLGTTPYPLLKWVQIGDIALPQVNLERFIKGLSEEIRYFYIHSVESDGSWAGIMDLLREKHSLRCLEGRCKIHFTSLWGGEFGEKKPKKEEADPFSALNFMSWKIPPEPVLITQSLQYVNGDPQMTENPLRCK